MPDNKLILNEFLPYQLSVTSNAVSDLIASSYRGRFALKVAEWRVMAVLGEQFTATQRDLTQATAMDKVTVSRATKALVNRGLIGRAPHDKDGRSHLLALTFTGEELYAQIVPMAKDVERQLADVLSSDDVRNLVDILSRLRARAEHMAEQDGK